MGANRMPYLGKRALTWKPCSIHVGIRLKTYPVQLGTTRELCPNPEGFKDVGCRGPGRQDSFLEIVRQGVGKSLKGYSRGNGLGTGSGVAAIAKVRRWILNPWRGGEGGNLSTRGDKSIQSALPDSKPTEPRGLLGFFITE